MSYSERLSLQKRSGFLETVLSKIFKLIISFSKVGHCPEQQSCDILCCEIPLMTGCALKEIASLSAPLSPVHKHRHNCRVYHMK